MQVISAYNISELKRIVRKLASSSRIVFLAGGTDLMVSLKDNVLSSFPLAFIDISHMKDMKGVSVSRTSLRIGALTTFSEITEYLLIKQHFFALYQAAASVGAPQIRNIATIGGNVATSSPAGDSIPALFVHNAEVEVLSSSGRFYRVDIDKFFTGPKRNVLKNGDIITSFYLPLKPTAHSAFLKLGPRLALSISKLSIAAQWIIAEKKVMDIKIAAGACGPTVLRAKSVEKHLKGKILTQSMILDSIALLSCDIAPIDDIRSTASYRANSAAELLRRLLNAII